MKKILLLFAVLYLSIAGYAQLEVKPGSFKEVLGFVNINTDIYEDDNNVLYSVIKVNTVNINDEQRRRLIFRGNESTFIELEYKVGEVWVYLSSKPATYLEISHPEYGSTEFWFPFDLEPRKGYEMILVNKTASKTAGMGTLTIKTKPEDGAKIKLNGTFLAYKTPFTYDMLAAGQYEVTVSKKKYKSVTKTVNIQDGDNQVLEIEMTYDMAVITVNADEETTVYIDDNYMKRGTWSGELVSGQHKIYLEKHMYQVAETTIQVEGGKDQTINLELSNEYAEITLKNTDGTGLFIDDREYWTAADPTLKISPGMHEIKSVVRFCNPDSLMINVVAGQPATYEFHYTPILCTVSVKSEPSGATVYLDDKKCGVTPLEVNVNQGDLFIVRIEKEGYIPLKSQKALIDEKYLEINQNLTKIKSIENAINAVYSVSPTNKVYFAKGNIQYHPATWTWRFAEHQWDVIGDANKNISEKYNGWIDLFSFRIDGDSDYNSVEAMNSTYVEWCEKYKNNTGIEGLKWRALKDEEWDYVLYKRKTASGINHAWATVNGVPGIILLPDSWNVSKYALQKAKDSQNKYSDNIVSLTDWTTKLEANGAVFLPAAGMRRMVTVDSAGRCGYYWSSSSSKEKVKGTRFYDWFATSFVESEGRVNAKYHAPGRYGLSVRPVCPLEIWF